MWRHGGSLDFAAELDDSGAVILQSFSRAFGNRAELVRRVFARGGGPRRL